MREVDLHVPFEAAQAMGLDLSPDDFGSADVRDVTVLTCDGPECITVVTYSDAVDETLDDAEYIESWELLDRDGDEVTYLCKTDLPDTPADSETTQDETLDVQSVTVEDDGWTLTLVGEQEALQCGGAFEGFDDIQVTLRRLTDYQGPTDELDTLTRRQREVVETAHELGYFEVPREANADDIADELDLDRSTVTEHLQRAERNLLSSLLAG